MGIPGVGWVYWESLYTDEGMGIPGIPPGIPAPLVLTSSDGHRIMRYAIYWNTFLLSLWQLHAIIET